MDVKKSKKQKLKDGEKLTCRVCGLIVVVDEICGCIETCNIICCEKQMKKIKAPKKAAAKKATKKAVQKTKTRTSKKK